MADSMNKTVEAAAFAGLADNPAIPLEDRLGCALEAIRLYEQVLDITRRDV